MLILGEISSLSDVQISLIILDLNVKVSPYQDMTRAMLARKKNEKFRMQNRNHNKWVGLP